MAEDCSSKLLSNLNRTGLGGEVLFLSINSAYSSEDFMLFTPLKKNLTLKCIYLRVLQKGTIGKENKKILD